MRKIVGSVLVVVAAAGLPGCRSAAPSVVRSSATGAVVTADGATNAAAAITAFLEAARVSEVSSMSRLFGTSNGPITQREGSVEVEKRMRALACYLSHDSVRLVEDLPGVGSGRAVTVELRQRELTRRARFTTVPGPRGRWFVESFDINALSDFCRPTGRTDGRSGGR